MPGSHAEQIVVDYVQSLDWVSLTETEAEPELDLPPLPPPPPLSPPAEE